MLQRQAGIIFRPFHRLNLGTAFQCLLAARVIDQYPLHYRNAYAYEMSAVLPISGLIAHQAQIRLVDQGSRLKGVTGPLVSQLKPGETAELVDDQRNQFFGCL